MSNLSSSSSPATRPLRVLFASPATLIGGEELSTLALARGLIARGHEAGLASEGGEMLPEFERAGVRFHHMGLYVRDPVSAWTASRPLRRLLEEHPYDVVHAQQVFTAGIAHLARQMPSRRSVGLIYHYRGVRPRFMPLVARVMPGITDFIVTNAEANRQAFLERGAPPATVQTIYNGFDWTPFDQPTDAVALRTEWGVPVGAPVVGVIGRLHPVKGHHLFLQAARRVVNEVPDAHFVIVGDGPLRGDLENLATGLGLGDRVKFLGFQRDVPRVLSGFDLLVLPSTEEAIGRVLVEAHAAGLPAVASRVGGTGEVVEDGVTGYLVPPGEVAALATRVVEVLEDPDGARSMGARGRERVRQRFGMERMMNEMEAVYRAVSPNH